MTQYGYEPLSPSDSGSTLLERINGVVPALVTNHKGPARPGYVQPGMMWIDDSGSEWLLNLYDGAGDVAIAAIDPDTHQALSQWVPATRTIASGLGVKINGGESATLAGTVTIGLDFATDAETVAGEIGNKAAAPSGVHAAIAAALAGLSAGGIKNVRLITASGSVTPSAGVTKWVGFIVDGGQPGNNTGPAGASGRGSIFIASVSPSASYSAVIGAVAGATSVVIAGTTYMSSNGLLNVPSSTGDSPTVISGVTHGGHGGNGPFGLGGGGAGGGGAATGYGAGGGGASNGTYGGAGTPGCILLWEF